MTMWRINTAGEREFTGGRESWDAAADAAADCGTFRTDVDEEIVTDDERSCYDCRYRRWTATSIICRAPQLVCGVIGSNMPGRLRHWSVLHGERID